MKTISLSEVPYPKKWKIICLYCKEIVAKQYKQVAQIFQASPLVLKGTFAWKLSKHSQELPEAARGMYALLQVTALRSIPKRRLSETTSLPLTLFI